MIQSLQLGQLRVEQLVSLLVFQRSLGGTMKFSSIFFCGDLFIHHDEQYANWNSQLYSAEILHKFINAVEVNTRDQPVLVTSLLA